jgi:hypothetical protein
MTVVHPQYRELPGIELFSRFFDLLGYNVVVVDRTGVLKTPIRTKAFSLMPEFRKFTKTYAEICDERALDLWRRSDVRELPVYVFYSGGVDSTLVLISLLKNATEVQKKRLRVLMSQESIGENPKFYQDHLMGKIRLEASAKFPHLLSKNAIFVGGEYNDQLFGSDAIRDFMNIHGEASIKKNYDRSAMEKMFINRWHDPAVVGWFLDLFESIYKRCPCPSGTNADFFWWLNFSIKWQSVYFRMLTYASDQVLKNIDKTFIEENFFHFFGTDDFQLWSMNNPDKKIIDTWESYKFEAKEVIYAFTKDDWYRKNKIKRGSLSHVIIHQIQKNFIDEDIRMYPTLEPEDWHNPDNDFLSL